MIRGAGVAWSAKVAPGVVEELRGHPRARVAGGHLLLRVQKNQTAAVERLYVDPEHALVRPEPR